MRCYQLVCVLLFWLCLSSPLVAQQARQVFNEHITNPDAWRPAEVSAPGVDAKGDLNLSIPVLTVPGRNGLDYNIVFSYTSGIKVAQQSSWIGLGWSFDPGSITRDVKGASSFNGNYQGVDYVTTPSDLRDIYYVTSPGGSFSMMRYVEVGSNLIGPRPPRTDTDGFMLLDWEPWKIMHDMAPAVIQGASDVPLIGTLETGRPNSPPNGDFEPHADYRHFVLTNPSGIRYVFAAPSISSYLSHDPSDPTNPNRVDYYVDSWRLVAILGTDYPHDPLEVPIFEDQIDDSDKDYKNRFGSWIYLTYSRPTTRSRERTGIGYEAQQQYYLEAIHTPTHKAVFETSSKPCEVDCVDLGGNSWQPVNTSPTMLRQLNAISLHTSSLVKRVELSFGEHASTVPEGSFSCPQMDANSNCRLRLDAVTFRGDDWQSPDVGSILPGYRFEYEEQVVENVGANDLDEKGNYVDDFGYYNTDLYNNGTDAHINDAKAWSLKKIVYPTGGEIDVVYENDFINLPVNSLGDLALGNYLPYNIPYNRYGIVESGSLGGGYYAIRSTEPGFNQTYDLVEDPEINILRTAETAHGVFTVVHNTILSPPPIEVEYTELITPNGEEHHATLTTTCSSNGNNELSSTYECVVFSTKLYGDVYISLTDNKIAFGSDADPNKPNPTKYGNQYQGGSRVFQLKRDTGHPGTARTTTYYYGNGRLSGVPSAVWRRDRPYDQYFTQNTRGQVAVYYSSIKADHDDETTTETIYSTDETVPGQVRPLNHTFYRHGMAVTVLQDNSQIHWGQVLHQSQGSPSQRTATTYSRIAGATMVSPAESYHWRYKNGLTKEEINADGLLTERHYFRDLTTGLVKRVEVHAPGEPIRITERTYGYEVYSDLESGNILTPVVREDQAQSTSVVASTPAGYTCEVGELCEDDVPELLGQDLLDEGCILIRDDPNGEIDEGVLKCPDAETGDAITYDPDATFQALNIPVTYFASTVTWWDEPEELWSEVPQPNTVPASTKWRPTGVFAWKSDTFASAVPGFDFDQGPSGSEWQTVTEFATYDDYGHVVVQKDAQGTELYFYYGTSADPCNNASVGSKHTYLTCVKVNDLEQRLAYNAAGGVASITDATEATTSFEYDSHQRLTEAYVNEQLTQSYSYYLSREAGDTYAASQPNAVTTLAHTGTSYRIPIASGFIDDPNGEIVYETTQYFDGLGQVLQFQAKHRNPLQGADEYILSAVEQLPLQRIVKTYKPIAIPSGDLDAYGAFLNESPWGRAVDQYGGVSPYTEVHTDGLGRPTDTYLPHRTLGGTERSRESMVYNVAYQESLDGQPLASQALIASATDPDGNVTLSYANAFGQNYLTRQLAKVPHDGTGLPPNIAGTATVTGVAGGGSFDPCSLECYEVNGQPMAPMPREISVTWGAPKTHLFTATETQVVQYAITPVQQSSFDTIFTFKVHKGSCSSSQIVASVNHRHNALSGYFVVSADTTYCVRVQVGIDDTSGPQDQFSLGYAVDFVKDGFITTFQDTRFEYDVAGNLIKVMPPNYFSPPQGSSPEQWVTTYRYNTLGQLLAKATPDTDGNNDTSLHDESAEHTPDFVYTYDAVGSLRFSQDPNQREVDSEAEKVEEVGFTVYDGLGRSLISGVGPASFANLDTDPTPTNCTETDITFVTKSEALECTPGHWHTVQRYDTKPDPTAFPWNAMPAAEWGQVGLDTDTNRLKGRLVATAYRIDLEDAVTKEFLNLYGMVFNTGAGSYRAHNSIEADNVRISGDANITFHAGERITLKPGFETSDGGSFAADIDPALQQAVGSDWLLAAYNYDAEGRIAAYYQYNAILGLIKSFYSYDRQGNLVAVQYQPQRTDAYYMWYDYDTLGRMIAIWSHDQNERDSATREAVYSYLPNGQVQQLALGVNPDLIPPITYQYHIRDWLTKINDPANPGTHVFSQELFYDALPTGLTGTTYTNGNIAAIDWHTQVNGGPDRARYAFTYDGLSRLIQSEFAKTSDGSTWDDNSTGAHNLSEVSYDANGNIQRLDRRDGTGGGTPLTYEYTTGSNQLYRVSGGIEPHVGTVTYDYDPNGNATTGRDISEITYDHRNLPLSMTLNSGELAMRYDASGQRFYKGLQNGRAWFYIRSVDGAVLAVYDENCILRYWNILAGTRPIGRVEPAFGVALGQ